MELFDDWRADGGRARAARTFANSPLSASDVFEALKDVDPPIVNVHCYRDVDYRWVHVVFEDVIEPGAAVAVGERLANVAGDENVFFNSLRPQAVYFLLGERAEDARTGFAPTRYGAPWVDIRKAWGGSATTSGTRTRATRARKQTARA